MNNAINRAITKLGGVRATGRICGVSPQAVMKWRERECLPRTEWTGETNYAELISLATKGAVTKAELKRRPA